MLGSSLSVNFVSLLLVIAVGLGGHPINELVEFKVDHVAADTPGGKLFKEIIGEDHVKQMMSSITVGIWEFIFCHKMDDIQKKVRKISLYIDRTRKVSRSTRWTNFHHEIHLGAEYLDIHQDSMEEEIHMLLTYEIAHILQNTGNDQIRPALKDGIAAFVVLKLSSKPNTSVKFTYEGVWDQHPDAIGRFLDYCATEYPGFVVTLNNKMEFSYRDDYFVELSGKTVDELWKEFRTKHDDEFFKETIGDEFLEDSGLVELKVDHVAADTRGGKLFKETIGEAHVKQMMSSITAGIWELVFWHKMDDIQKKVRRISLYIDQTTSVCRSTRRANNHYEIHLGAEFLEKHKDSMEKEIHMLLTYAIAHILQNTGNDQIRPALKDGIAAFVVFKLSTKPNTFVKFTDEGVWDQRPSVIGRFLDFCATEYPSFVEKLNNKMEFSYTDDYFVELSGKTVDELWKEFKTKHGDSNA